MPTNYCTQADIERLLSLEGVQSFGDMDQSGLEDDDVIADVIEQASDEITAKLYPLYAEAELATCRLVTRWATVLAAFYLCHRRGNTAPQSLHDDYQRIMEPKDGLLAQVRDKRMVLPGLAQRSVNVPSFSNLEVDRRYRREKIRVIPTISSPIPSTIEQDVTREPGLDG